MAEKVITNSCRILEPVEKLPVRFREASREFCLNCSKITLGHSGADIHPIGMQCLEPTQVPPGLDDPFVFEEGHQKVLVIACQGDHGGRPLTTRKLLHDPHGSKTAV